VLTYHQFAEKEHEPDDRLRESFEAQMRLLRRRATRS
jgi:hypothetical protein